MCGKTCHHPLSYDLFLYVELGSQYGHAFMMVCSWICNIESWKSPVGSQLLPYHNYHTITNDEKSEIWRLTALITCDQTLKSFWQKKQRVALNTVHDQTAPLK